MPLDPKRVQAVFGAALECDAAADRAAVLDRECSTDAELRRRVEALLAAHDQADSLLDRPIVGSDSTAPSRTARRLERTEADSLIDGPDGLRPDDRARARRRALPLGGTRRRRRTASPPSISGYEILEELGRGGMGVVYRARQVRLDRPCALKMILGGAHARPEAAARFLAEAQAIARLQHPNIVQIHHIGEADGLPFFELEYIDGGSLDKTLDGTPWAARRAAGLVELLAGAVAEAHRLGIVHRDLKPGNILLTADGTPKITDFGLAKSLGTDSGLTATDSIMGSPSYMAPEQAAGQTKQLGPPADVYALGATLYELLTGRPPFRGATILETLEQVKTVEPVPPSRLVPGLPRDVETIALKCLQKEPGKRYDSAAALAEDLRRFLDGEPIVARPVPAWERAWRWCRRHPAPAALTAAVVLVAALGLAGILWQWGEAVTARDLASRRGPSPRRQARREAETILVDMYTTSGIAAGDQGEHAAGGPLVRQRRPAGRGRPRPPARQRGPRPDLGPPGVHAAPRRRRRGIVAGGLVFHPGGRHLITRTVIDGKARDRTPYALGPGGRAAAPVPRRPDGRAGRGLEPRRRALAVGRPEGDVIVAGFPGGEEATRIRFPGRVRLLVYSPDGRYLAIAGGNSARVWDVRSRGVRDPGAGASRGGDDAGVPPRGPIPGDRVPRTSRPASSPSPASRRARSGRPSPTSRRTRHRWYPAFFSPPLFVDGGRGLITYGGKGVLTWRAVETGAEVRTLGLPRVGRRGSPAIEPSPDGRYLAVLGFQPPQRPALRGRHGPRRRAGPGAQEHRIRCGLQPRRPDARDRLDRQHGPALGRPRRRAPGPAARPPPHRPPRRVRARRAIAGHSGRRPGPPLGSPRGGRADDPRALDGRDSFAALSPDGALLIPTGMSFEGPEHAAGARGPFASRPAEPAGPPLRPGGMIVDAAFSPDGRSVATLGVRDGPSTEGQEVVVWDWASGRRAMAGGAALRAPERGLPPRRPPPRRALRRRGIAGLRRRRRPRGPPLARPRRRARPPLDQQRRGRASAPTAGAC